MQYNRKELILQAKSSCAYQDDLSIDSIKRYVRCCEYVRKVDSYLCLQDIINLGNLISPKNNGLRTTPAIFRTGKRAVHPSNVKRLLETILDAKKEFQLNATEFFTEFEQIHPFNDGNGRVGEILYWYMTGSFACPHSHFSNHD